MEIYKECPICLEKNDKDSIECSKCGYDLTGIGITYGQGKSETDTNGNNDLLVEYPLVKICDCGAINPPNARICNECGEDISDIAPERDKKNKKTLHLYDMNGKELYNISTGNIVIGRNNGLGEYLTGKNYVSNSHCKLYLEDEDFFIEDLNSTNSTFVNNKKISEKTILTDHDEIALGGIIVDGERQEKAAYFQVKIE